MKKSLTTSCSRVSLWIVSILGGMLWSCGEEDHIAPRAALPVQDDIVIQDEFEGVKIVVYNNPAFELMVAFNRELDGEVLSFQSTDSFPAVMKDNQGNFWNVFGEAAFGPVPGRKLEYLNQVKGFWFSVASFYKEATLYREQSQRERIVSLGQEGWLIDTDYVVRAAQPNIIQALYYPDFEEFHIKEMIFEGDHRVEDLILAIKINQETRLYPERVLDFHEIVNDEVSGTRVALSFCPLTATSFCWASQNDLTFYVSGLLYNANLILGDWETNSLWSQIYGRSVFGARQNDEVNRLPAIEMNWLGALELIDKDNLLVPPQKIPERSPYQSYKTSNSIGFPVDFVDDRLPAKEKVLAVIVNDKAKVYTTRD